MSDEQRNEIALLIVSGTRANNTTPEHTIELLDALTALYNDAGRLLARALLAERQRDYWIEQAERHGHGPSADEVPFSDPEPPSAAEVEECLEEVGDD